ncbi:hypothetical protein BDV11DRAFT_174172 [Aspergillus similis]
MARIFGCGWIPGMTRFPSKAKAIASYKIIQDVGNFKEIESTWAPFKHCNSPIEVTKSPFPYWEYGQGVSDGVSRSSIHNEIDPYASTRETVSNYRLLISVITPRPIGYFQLVDHDPPMFILGFSGRPGREKDTSRNLRGTGECVINTVSENMIEAMNATSLDALYGISEWEISGLAKAPSSTARPARVNESVFSIEGKVIDIKEFAPHQEGMSGSGVLLIKATRFWVKEGVANEDLSHIELKKLRPVAQLGGISYGRITSTFERPRTRWAEEVKKSPVLKELENGIGMAAVVRLIKYFFCAVGP